MKIKLTFLVIQSLKQLNFTSPRYFQILFDDSKQIPHHYISTKNEEETLRQIAEKHLNIDFDWMQTDVCGFRKIAQEEFEVVYVSYVPQIDNSNKSGFFLPDCDLDKHNIKLDPYYERLLSERSRGF